MEIVQARILEWVAMPSSRGSSQPKHRTQVSCIAGGFFSSWATREAHVSIYVHINCNLKFWCRCVLSQLTNVPKLPWFLMFPCPIPPGPYFVKQITMAWQPPWTTHSNKINVSPALSKCQVPACALGRQMWIRHKRTLISWIHILVEKTN